MRVFMDWEFLEEGNSIYPISVGIVSEDGEELYYEFIDAPWGRIVAHEWLNENVLPVLSPGHHRAIVTGEGNATVKSTLTIRMKVHNFLQSAGQRDPHNELELWGWYSSYDHVCLGQLFGAMVNLPSFVPMWTNDLKQEAYRLGDIRIPDLRKPSEKVHNALDDARAELRMHQWLMEFKKSGRVDNSLK